MKIKTSELIGKQLDWAVELAKGTHWSPNGYFIFKRPTGTEYADKNAEWNYSTDWSQAGPIIEREKITIVCAQGDYNPNRSETPDCFDTYWVVTLGRLTADTVYGPQGDNWGEHFQIPEYEIQGTTPLVAAMRCYVASKLGDEVELPEELI